MNRFQQIQQILDTAVGGPTAVVAGPHGAFWRSQTRDEFVQFEIAGLSIVTVGDGDGSAIVKALRGQDPFGSDTGTPGAVFRRMPAGRPPVPAQDIDIIARWIDDGCPEVSADVGPLEILLNGAPSDEGFVIATSAQQPLSGTMTIRTTDGSEGNVTVRVSQGSVVVSPQTVTVSAQPAEVQVRASVPSDAKNDTTLEVLQGSELLARFNLTAIAAPKVRFSGRFQCRLATDPDPFDHPWGINSSFGVYAVQGPDPDSPDEAPLDRIIRFHDPVSLRPFCTPVGVSVVAIEAQVGGETVRFTKGDPMLGQPVRLGPNCKFDGRNETFAPNGYEPISDFRLEVGSLFAGESAKAVPRASADDPPGSTAPYADGIFRLGVDPTPWSPRDFGYPQETWAERGWEVVATKLAQLVSQQPANDRAKRIRDRRIREHAPGRLGSINFPIELMERYTGLIDQAIMIVPGATGALAYLAGLPAIEFYAEFLDFDTDCQTGTVTGTLGNATPHEEATPDVRANSALRRVAPAAVGLADETAASA